MKWKKYAWCQRHNKYFTVADHDRPWRHWIQSVLHKVRCYDPPTAIGRCMVFVNIVTNQRVPCIAIVILYIDYSEADLQVIVCSQLLDHYLHRSDPDSVVGKQEKPLIVRDRISFDVSSIPHFFLSLSNPILWTKHASIAKIKSYVPRFLCRQFHYFYSKLPFQSGIWERHVFLNYFHCRWKSFSLPKFSIQYPITTGRKLL